jgi:hypothetical protein
MRGSRCLLRLSILVIGVSAFAEIAAAIAPGPGTCRERSRWENQNGIRVLCRIKECTPEVTGGFAPIPVVEKKCGFPDSGPLIPSGLQLPPLGPSVLPGGGGTTAPDQ